MWLLVLIGKVAEAVVYLESAAESFGPKHIGMEMDGPQTAIQVFALAKDVMDFAMGQHYADTIQICRSLATACRAMGR